MQMFVNYLFSLPSILSAKREVIVYFEPFFKLNSVYTLVVIIKLRYSYFTLACLEKSFLSLFAIKGEPKLFFVFLYRLLVKILHINLFLKQNSSTPVVYFEGMNKDNHDFNVFLK